MLWVYSNGLCHGVVRVDLWRRQLWNIPANKINCSRKDRPTGWLADILTPELLTATSISTTLLGYLAYSDIVPPEPRLNWPLFHKYMGKWG